MAEKQDVKTVTDDAISAREAILARYQESQGIKTDEPKSEEMKKEEPKKEEAPKTDLKPADAPSDKGAAGTGPDKKPDAASSAEKKEEPVKMVPHQALHEERQKHQTTKAQVSELQQKLDTVLQDMKKVMEERKSGDAKKEQDDSDFDIATKAELKASQAKISELESQLSELKAGAKKRDESEQAEAQRKVQADLQTKIASVNDRLAEEGFPGFSECTPLVTQELRRLVQEDEANAHLDNPEGWSKVYKETIYPKVSKIISQQNRDKKIEEKKALKAEANLAGGPGQAPSKEEKGDDKWSYEDYIAERKRVSVAT